MKNKRYLLDTGVIIGILKKWPESYNLFLDLEQEQIYFSVINEAEIYSGIRSRNSIKHQEYLDSFLFKSHKVYPIESKTVQMTSEVYNLAKKVGRVDRKVTPDLYIAATCLLNDLTLVTYNKKDFDYIPGLKAKYLVRDKFN